MPQLIEDKVEEVKDPSKIAQLESEIKENEIILTDDLLNNLIDDVLDDNGNIVGFEREIGFKTTYCEEYKGDFSNFIADVKSIFGADKHSDRYKELRSRKKLKTIDIGEIFPLGKKRFYKTVALKNTFRNCSHLSKVNIPQSVKLIMENTFYNCTSLSTISIPSSVIYIGDSAFKNCSRLSNVKIPDNSQLKVLDNNSFSDCSSIYSINIPDNVWKIGDKAFANCQNLKNVNIPFLKSCIGSIEIGNSAFKNCYSLQKINIPLHSKYIGDSAFEGCSSLNEITIPIEAKIGNKAFANCYNLKNVDIPNSVTEIGDNAFKGIENINYHGSATGAPWGAYDINHTKKYSTIALIVIAILLLLFFGFKLFHKPQQQQTTQVQTQIQKQNVEEQEPKTSIEQELKQEKVIPITAIENENNNQNVNSEQKQNIENHNIQPTTFFERYKAPQCWSYKLGWNWVFLIVGIFNILVYIGLLRDYCKPVACIFAPLQSVCLYFLIFNILNLFQLNASCPSWNTWCIIIYLGISNLIIWTGNYNNLEAQQREIGNQLFLSVVTTLFIIPRLFM